MNNGIAIDRSKTTTARIRRMYTGNTDRIGIRHAQGVDCVHVDDILCCEAWSNYCRIHLAGRQEPVIVSKTLNKVASVLPDDSYFRAHQSFLVRLDSIESVGDNLRLSNGMKVPVSRRQRPGLMTWLRKNITLI